MMDDDSGESTGVDEVAGVGRDESELEWLVVLLEVLVIFTLALQHRFPC